MHSHSRLNFEENYSNPPPSDSTLFPYLHWPHTRGVAINKFSNLFFNAFPLCRNALTMALSQSGVSIRCLIIIRHTFFLWYRGSSSDGSHCHPSFEIGDSEATLFFAETAKRKFQRCFRWWDWFAKRALRLRIVTVFSCLSCVTKVLYIHIAKMGI